jgi:NADH:ubiquinone oxidoreductase subunit 6 (subunit J)
MTSVLFYLFAALVAIAALAMVLSRNLVHAALYMAAAFLGMAFIYLLLQADYVAVVQILVYVGAISILFVFGIMLTKRERMEDSNRFNRYGIVAAVVGLAFFALLARAILVSAIVDGAGEQTQALAANSATSISKLFLGALALPLEASALLLLAALVGAIVVGTGKGKKA